MARWGVAAVFSLLVALTGVGVRAQAPVSEADRDAPAQVALADDHSSARTIAGPL